MSVLRSHNNKTRGGLGRVCATGMYRSIEHVKFPKFQTGIFVEWKAPQFSKSDRLEFWLNGSRPNTLDETVTYMQDSFLLLRTIK